MASVVNTPLAEDADLRDDGVGAALVEIGLVSVWAELWAREGLARRDRSLVTLGILIALGAEDELGSHVRIGLNNGLTEDEIAGTGRSASTLTHQYGHLIARSVYRWRMPPPPWRSVYAEHKWARRQQWAWPHGAADGGLGGFVWITWWTRGTCRS
ncbi:carboxymuconolactone decarboxylase family protein [Streptomyces sp. NPDC004270]